MKSVLFFGLMVALAPAFGQGIRHGDLSFISKSDFEQPVWQQDMGGGREITGCSYILDDGSLEYAVGLFGGGEIMWLNYFTAQSGCEIIHKVSVTWANMPNGAPCRVILYEDPDDDGNPDDAVYMAECCTTVENAGSNIFTDVGITPTPVSGGFFVAALVACLCESSYPAPLDNSTEEMHSWIAYNLQVGEFDVYNLSNNTEIIYMQSSFIPGNWMLRAQGASAVYVPLSDWALFLGIGLILVFGILRLRRVGL